MNEAIIITRPTSLAELDRLVADNDARVQQQIDIANATYRSWKRGLRWPWRWILR